MLLDVIKRIRRFNKDKKNILEITEEQYYDYKDNSKDIGEILNKQFDSDFTVKIGHTGFRGKLSFFIITINNNIKGDVNEKI